MALLLVFGVQVWLIIGRANWGTQRQLHWMAIALVLALIPPVARYAARFLDRLRMPSRRLRWTVAGVILVASAGYLYLSALHQHRTFGFTAHDEYSYAIQAQMLARGRLWMPEHPAPDSFDSFYLIVRPVYASMYFPGAAMFWAVGIWLHWAWWGMPLLVTAMVLSATYLVITELIDGLAGLLAVFLMIGVADFRIISLMLYSQMPLLLLGLLMILSWLQWRRHRRPAWALLIGLFAGWAMITRPLDALIFALPIGTAMLIDLLRQARPRIAMTIAAGLFGILPFAAIQLTANRGITGSWFTTPQGLYTREQFPGAQLGFASIPQHAQVNSRVPQKHVLYQTWVREVEREHQPHQFLTTLTRKRLPISLASTLPSALLVILIPLGWAAAAHRRRWVLVAGLPLLIALYAFYPFFLRHYPIVAAPAAAAAVIIGAWEIAETWPRLKSFVTTATTFILLAASIAALPELNRYAHDELSAPETQQANKLLAKLPKKPALVLFKWTPDADTYEEPVYNTDSAWPDDAPIVRAHDLSDTLNRRLIDYYAKRQPRREVYLIRRPAGKFPVQDLGTVSQLAASYNLKPAQKEKP